jgi:hypothetical protein
MCLTPELILPAYLDPPLSEGILPEEVHYVV